MFAYLKRRREEWQAGVTHVTLNPREPGVVRIHLVPPRPGLRPAPHLVFLNGWWILAVSPSEARLIRYFVDELESCTTPGEQIDDDQMAAIRDAVSRRMQAMYPGVEVSRFGVDLQRLLDVFVAVAQGREPPEGAPQETVSIADYALHLRGPHRMDLIVSPMILGKEWLCPNHCPNCYALGQPAMRIERELTTGQWCDIIDRCWQIGIPEVCFTGGEPTMRDDLVELVGHAGQFVTRVNTSGVTMTPELARALYDASLDAVQITLYSAEPAVHDRLVGNPGAWDKTMQGIRNALAAGLYVSVNTPLTRANADFTTTVRFVHELGVCYVSCSGLIPAGGAPKTIAEGGALNDKELYQILEPALAYGRSAGVEMSFTSPGWLSAGQLESLHLDVPVCGACLSNMAVAPDGNVVPCQSWLDGRRNLGDISQVPWRRIWDSSQCRTIRKRAAMKNECPLGAQAGLHTEVKQ